MKKKSKQSSTAQRASLTADVRRGKVPVSKHRVIIPVEKGRIVSFDQEALPGIAAINSALRDFEPKIVFAWHLSLVLSFSGFASNGMPSREEREVTEAFRKMLDSKFKGDDHEKPNALFLARVTWNGTLELVYRVFDPEPIDAFLKQMVDGQSHPRKFEYQIDHDPKWARSAWLLNAGEEDRPTSRNERAQVPLRPARP